MRCSPPAPLSPPLCPGLTTSSLVRGREVFKGPVDELFVDVSLLTGRWLLRFYAEPAVGWLTGEHHGCVAVWRCGVVPDSQGLVSQRLVCGEHPALRQITSHRGPRSTECFDRPTCWSRPRLVRREVTSRHHVVTWCSGETGSQPEELWDTSVLVLFFFFQRSKGVYGLPVVGC